MGPRPRSRSASPDQTSGHSVSAALRAQRRRRTGPSSPRALGTGRPQHAVQLSRGPSLACRLTRNDRLGFSSIYSPTVMTSLIGHVPSGKGVFYTVPGSCRPGERETPSAREAAAMCPPPRPPLRDEGPPWEGLSCKQAPGPLVKAFPLHVGEATLPGPGVQRLGAGSWHRASPPGPSVAGATTRHMVGRGGGGEGPGSRLPTLTPLPLS